MKPWKHKLLVAALPVAAITVGCLAAQDDVDELIDDDAEFREAPITRNHVQLRIGDPGFDWLYAAEIAADVNQLMHEQRMLARERNREAGSGVIDDLILSAILEDKIGVAFRATADGGIDPCQIDVPVGAGALIEHEVQLRSFDSAAPEEFIVMDQVESAEACEAEGVGYYYAPDASGEMNTIAVCPEACEAISHSAAEGSSIMMDLVILE